MTVPKKRATTKKKAAAKQTKPAAVPKIPAPSLGLYRRIAGAFVVLVALVLVVVLFVSTTRATIRVTPLATSVESGLVVEAGPDVLSETGVKGIVLTRQFEQAESFPVTQGEQKEVFGKAGGIVTIVNESDRTQPLVATTRLLSSGGVLFRLDEGVTVPAHGKVEATAHADQEGATGDIAPDRFTIPGLSTSLQSVIYATSIEAMTGGRRLVTVLTEEELSRAAGELETTMFEAAKTQLRAEAPEGFAEAFESSVAAKTTDTTPGAETDAFTISLTLEVTGVFYDSDAVEKLSEQRLYAQLEKGYVFQNLDAAPTVNVSAVNAQAGTAQLSIARRANMVVSLTHPLLQASGFVGLTEEDVRERLVSAGVASNVELDIFPPWIRTVPTLKDHIEVVIE